MQTERWWEWPDCPTSVRGAVDEFVGLLQDLAGPRLNGVYLHGSLALDGFNPSLSDIDLLAMVGSEPGAAFRRSLAGWLLEHSGYPHPLEVHVLRGEDLNPWRHPAPFAFHYSEAWRERMRSALASASAQDPRELMPPVDPDLTAPMMVVPTRGKCLWREPIEEVFPEVLPEDYGDAIPRDVADAPAADELPAEQRAGFVRYMMRKVLEQRGQGAKAARPR